MRKIILAQTIERTALSSLVANEDYARKVMPHMRADYFSDRTERIRGKERRGYPQGSHPWVAACIPGSVHRRWRGQRQDPDTARRSRPP